MSPVPEEAASLSGYLAEQLVAIQVALGRVTTLDGQVERYPAAFLVDALVRDHEELESRIEATLLYLAGIDKVNAPEVSDLVLEVTRLLRGGRRMPDTIEGLD